MGRKTEKLNIRIDPDLKRRAQVAAEADERSLGSLIAKLLGDYVQDFEARDRLRKPTERRK